MPLQILNPSSGTVTGLTPGAVQFGDTDGSLGEDPANLFWDDTDDTFTVGTNTDTITVGAVSFLTRIGERVDSNLYVDLCLQRQNNTNTTAPRLYLARSHASATIVSNGDRLGELGFLGHDGVDFEVAAAIRAEVDGTPSSPSDMPGALVFMTFSDGGGLNERMRIEQSGRVIVGMPGSSSFVFATGIDSLAVSDRFEVEGQSYFEGTMGFQTTPASNTIFTTTLSSGTIINGIDLDMTATPSSSLTATGINVRYRDEATASSAILTVIGAAVDNRYGRLNANQPASYNQHGFRVAGYGVASGTTITSGAYTYHGLSINASNAGANVSGGTHTLFDILTTSAPTGYPVGTRHYSIKLNDDAWAIDNAELWFGDGQDCSIVYTGTNWVFDVALATTAIVFNEAGTDTDFRVEGDTEANLLFCDSTASAVGIGTGSPGSRLELEETRTLGAGLGDGLAAALLSDPGYTGAFTVTRHNYLKCEDVSVAASAVVTDSCLFWADAAAGTHKMIDSGTTKVSVGVVTAWIKANVNGAVRFIPCYSSKTS